MRRSSRRSSAAAAKAAELEAAVDSPSEIDDDDAAAAASGGDEGEADAAPEQQLQLPETQQELLADVAAREADLRAFGVPAPLLADPPTDANAATGPVTVDVNDPDLRRLQSLPDIPSICQFTWLFQQPLAMKPVTPDDLELALLFPARHPLLAELITKLALVDTTTTTPTAAGERATGAARLKPGEAFPYAVASGALTELVSRAWFPDAATGTAVLPHPVPFQKKPLPRSVFAPRVATPAPPPPNPSPSPPPLESAPTMTAAEAAAAAVAPTTTTTTTTSSATTTTVTTNTANGNGQPDAVTNDAGTAVAPTTAAEATKAQKEDGVSVVGAKRKASRGRNSGGGGGGKRGSKQSKTSAAADAASASSNGNGHAHAADADTADDSKAAAAAGTADDDDDSNDAALTGPVADCFDPVKALGTNPFVRAAPTATAAAAAASSSADSATAPAPVLVQLHELPVVERARVVSALCDARLYGDRAFKAATDAVEPTDVRCPSLGTDRFGSSYYCFQFGDWRLYRQFAGKRPPKAVRGADGEADADDGDGKPTKKKQMFPIFSKAKSNSKSDANANDSGDTNGARPKRSKSVAAVAAAAAAAGATGDGVGTPAVYSASTGVAINDGDWRGPFAFELVARTADDWTALLGRLKGLQAQRSKHRKEKELIDALEELHTDLTATLGTSAAAAAAAKRKRASFGRIVSIAADAKADGAAATAADADTGAGDTAAAAAGVDEPVPLERKRSSRLRVVHAARFAAEAAAAEQKARDAAQHGVERRLQLRVWGLTCWRDLIQPPATANKRQRSKPKAAADDDGDAAMAGTPSRNGRARSKGRR